MLSSTEAPLRQLRWLRAQRPGAGAILSVGRESSFSNPGFVGSTVVRSTLSLFERCSVGLPCFAAVGMMLSVFAQQPVAPPSPQTPPAVFRTGVGLIPIDVVVLDKNRRPITGLTPSDFFVHLDRKPASIDVFAAVTLPEPPRLEGAPRWVGEVPSDVATNRYGNDGRLVVIMMDRTIPAGPPTLTARAIARSAVDALGPDDVAAVVRSGFAREGVSQGLTTDKARLRAVIDAPAAVGGAGSEWVSHFPLKPGRYEVRVGIQPKASSVASSVYGYIDVPELKSDALAMSGVRFESALGASRPQPTLRRTFVGREAIDAFVQVRRAVGSHAPVSIRVTVSDDRDLVAVEKTRDLDERAFAADVAAYRYPLPLSELRPGRYVLRIEASQETAVERRAVPFVVGEP